MDPPSLTQRTSPSPLRSSPFAPKNLPPVSVIRPPLRSTNLTIQSRRSIVEKRNTNFILSLCYGAFFFALGVVLGFTSAVYNHETTQLAWVVGTCVFVVIVASLRLPIVYHVFLPEPPTKWQEDRSWSLTIAIAIVGMAFGLCLPAEFILIEICIIDPSEMSWDRGGWVLVLGLLLPLGIGVVVCISDIRSGMEEREKWLRIRRGRRRRRGETEGEDSKEDVKLLVNISTD